MAGSTKKKDFQKTKHRVGKAKPKPTNATNTSFKAKSITVKQQALSTTAPNSSSQFAHYLALVTHKGDSQRRDAVAFLTTAVTSTPPNQPLPQPVSVIIEKSQQLILDGTRSVREQLLKLYQSLPPTEIDVRSSESLLLYIRAAMTHLSSEIRNSSLDFLGWLLQVDGTGAVSSQGGWVKTLQCFVSLLGWREHTATGAWTGPKLSFGNAGSDVKAMAKQLQALAAFIRAGLHPHNRDSDGIQNADSWFPLRNTESHLISGRSNAFSYLSLHGATRNEDTEMYEDREDRQRIFHALFQNAITKGVQQAQREAGEMGRASVQVKKAVSDGMADFVDE
ncbi:pre-rRNA-processing protein ipi1 [Pseudovirgaria hyperparasitica]|uniref:Pre-rRNA-processing protein n=1 Tax=Pseudovirgaria hyperparasitica TaxID=470096 RepID=A0A6A6VUV8_9PEZI|nr:pre-rRNA-processing protein ipi1 [Pseudovirgaria hyperparasitica]KAF2753400.1 pre-rRNA-processing protein ipi1 [Pseudovirgaria hyperparasitica]